MEREASDDKEDSRRLIDDENANSSSSTFQIEEQKRPRPRAFFLFNKRYRFAIALPLLLILLLLLYFTTDLKSLFRTNISSQRAYDTTAIRESQLRALNLLAQQQSRLVDLWSRNSSASLQHLRSALIDQISLNKKIQQALLSSHHSGDWSQRNATLTPTPTPCAKVDHKSSPRRTIDWKPRHDKYLFAICTSGQMSNHLICLEKHMFFAALLHRVLVIPSAKVDYEFNRVLDIDHINKCLGRQVVVTFEDFAERKKNHMHIDKVLCYFSLPQPCYVDDDHVKKLKAIGVTMNDLKTVWTEEDVKKPTLRTIHEVTQKFSSDDDVLAIGDVFFADVEKDWVMQPGGPIAHKCQTLIEPSRVILLTAQRFIQTFLGQNFVALHFRRHGFLKFCNAKNPSCFFPIPQAAECISRLVERANIPVIYLSTDAAESETGLLQALVTLNGKSVPLITRPARNSAEKWDALLYRKKLDGDPQFDQYAPSVAKNLVAEFQSLIYKNKPLFKQLITTIQTIITPLITTTIFLLQTTNYLIQNLIITTTTTTTTTTAPGGEATETIEKGLTTTQTPLESTPQVGTMRSFLKDSLDAAKSLAPDTILEKGSDLVNQAQDTTKSLAGGIPVVGDAAESLVTNATDLANQAVNTADSIVKENPVLDAVDSAAQSSLDTAKSLTPDAILQKGSDLVNQAQDTTKSLAGDIPLVGDAAESLVTNATDLADQVVNTADSLVKENPVLDAVDSAAQNIAKKPQATGTKAALQSAYMTLKLALVPVIAQLWYEVVNKYPTVAEVSEFILPVVECMCKLYNKVVTYMDEKGYTIFGYLPLVPIDEVKAAYKLVKTSSDALSTVGDLLGTDNNKGLSAVGDILGMNKKNTTEQAQDTTKSLVGGIPLVGEAAQSLADTGNSLVNENPVLDAVTSAAENIGKKPQATGTKAALQSAYMTLNLAAVPVIAQLWYELVNKYPLVAEVSGFILPEIECLCKLYNKVVTYMDGKGYGFAGYLPLVPVDEIEAAYKLVKTTSDGLSAVGDLLGTNNNKGLSAIGDLIGANKSN